MLLHGLDVYESKGNVFHFFDPDPSFRDVNKIKFEDLRNIQIIRRPATKLP